MYEPLQSLPFEFQRDWQASLKPSTPTGDTDDGVGGIFKLVNIRTTKPRSFEEQRIIVLVVDENGFPLHNIKVAFSFSSANPYLVTDDFYWIPPHPYKADIFPTQGSGQIEHIQGSVVKAGEPGGVTVYIVEPRYSSDVVMGMGTLADHTGVHLTFQLRRNGVVSFEERFAEIEARLTALEK